MSDMQMYGVANIETYIKSVTESFTYKFTGGNMIVAGLMSDAQEQMSFDDTEGARKTLNIAKAILFRIMDGQLVGTQEKAAA